jgi:hypothetical protein
MTYSLIVHLLHCFTLPTAAPQTASINPTAEDPNTSTTSSTATSVKKIVEKENGKEKEKEREAVPSKAYRDFVERNKRNSKVEEHLVKDQKREQHREQGRETSPPSVAGMVYKDSRTPSVASHARTNATPISTDNTMSVDALAEETVKEPEISPNLMKPRTNSSTANNEDTSEYSKYVFSNRSKRNSSVNIPVPDSLISEQQGAAQNVDGNGNGNGNRDPSTPERMQKNVPSNVSTAAVHASPLRNASSWIKEGNVPHWVRNGSGSESGSPQSQFNLKSHDGSFRGSSPPRNGSRAKDEVKERESEKEKEKDSEKDMRERRIEGDKIRESEKGNEIDKEKAKENGNAVENGVTLGADDATNKATETQPTPMKTRDKSKSSEEKPKKKRIILDADTQRLCSQAEIFRREGGEYYSKEDYLKALASFEKSLHLGPKAWGNRPTVLGNRAATFMMLGR